MTEEIIDKATTLWQAGNEKQAIELLESVDLDSSAQANTLIGQMYVGAEEGISNISKNLEKGIGFLNKGLGLGDAEAGLEIADIFYLGNGLEENHALAEEYWIRSWQLGDELAGFKLANYYYDDHIEKIQEALKIYTELIERNEFVGNCNLKLSKIYKRGIGGVIPDSARALKYLQAGAENSNVNCCMTLGLKYYRGDGVEKDVAKAIELLERVKDNDLFKQEVDVLLDKIITKEKTKPNIE